MTLLTVAELARKLKLSKSKIYELKDKIGWYRVGGSVRFTEADVQAYLDSCRVENGRPKQRATHRPLRYLSSRHGA